jgi:hypothetical protein
MKLTDVVLSDAIDDDPTLSTSPVRSPTASPSSEKKRTPKHGRHRGHRHKEARTPAIPIRRSFSLDQVSEGLEGSGLGPEVGRTGSGRGLEGLHRTSSWLGKDKDEIKRAGGKSGPPAHSVSPRVTSSRLGAAQAVSLEEWAAEQGDGEERNGSWGAGRSETNRVSDRRSEADGSRWSQSAELSSQRVKQTGALSSSSESPVSSQEEESGLGEGSSGGSRRELGLGQGLVDDQGKDGGSGSAQNGVGVSLGAAASGAEEVGLLAGRENGAVGVELGGRKAETKVVGDGALGDNLGEGEGAVGKRFGQDGSARRNCWLGVMTLDCCSVSNSIRLTGFPGLQCRTYLFTVWCLYGLVKVITFECLP